MYRNFIHHIRFLLNGILKSSWSFPVSGQKCWFWSYSEEDLETHLVACEIYDCKKCDLRFQNLSTMKTHLQEAHKGHTQLVTLIHAKIDRKNSDIVACKEHNGKSFLSYR